MVATKKSAARAASKPAAKKTAAKAKAPAEPKFSVIESVEPRDAHAVAVIDGKEFVFTPEQTRAAVKAFDAAAFHLS